MSQWRATGASSARPAVRSSYRIGTPRRGSVPARGRSRRRRTRPSRFPASSRQSARHSPSLAWPPRSRTAVAGAAGGRQVRRGARARPPTHPGRRPTSTVALPNAAATTRTPSVSIAKPQPPSPAGEPAVALADLLTRTGRREEASTIWQALLRTGQIQRTGAALGRSARAAQALGQVRLSNSYFQTAANLSPDDPQVHARWGDLFLEKFNEAEARSSYETALKADAQYVPALVGMARALADSNPTAAEAAARQAISHRSRSARRVGVAGLGGHGRQQARRRPCRARESAGGQSAARRGARAVGGAGAHRGSSRRRDALLAAGAGAAREQRGRAAHHRRARGPHVPLRRGRPLPARGRGARSGQQPRPGLARPVACCGPATRRRPARRSTPPLPGTRSTRSPTTC